MTDVGVGPMSAEETRVRKAADQAYRVLEGEGRPTPTHRDRWLELLSNATREAPLQALAIAFILGAIFARPRR
jgi:truncated hemoglobin YjbI